MALRLKKLGEIEEVNTFLRGGHVGGKDIRKGVFGLHGKTLVFTSPAGTVTFATPGASLQEALTAKEIITQINAVHAGMAGTAQHGKLFLEMTVPVAIVATGASTALALLGLDQAGITGVVYNPPGTPPALEWISPSPVGDGTYHLLLDD